MQQASLFDIGLEFKENNVAHNFKDETQKRIEKLEWHSPEKQTFFYDDTDNKKLTLLTLDLKGERRINKNGKFEFILQRYWHYSDLEECIDDEVKCKKVEDLEKCFEDEILLFKSDLYLPKNIVFDGRRYFFRFRLDENQNMIFKERVIPTIDF